MNASNKNLNNQIINAAEEVCNAAIVGIKELLESLEKDYIAVVETLYALKGKVIVSGMGKSGHIARKIAATFSSTGTSAFFVHPGEASHGDLGMITKDDLVILLSNSGETEELKDIINYTRRFHIPLISFTKNNLSSLGQQSDFVIKLPDAPEALEFDAPTTSSTMMLVLGDAIAMSLLEKRGFTREQFKIFHPGGRLGASFVRVGDLMHMKESLPISKENDSAKQVIIMMTSKGFGCSAVINDNNELLGIVTDGNLRRAISENFYENKAKDLMTPNPVVITANKLAVEALDLMNRKKITSILVVDEKNNKELIGLIHMHDCLSSGASPLTK